MFYISELWEHKDKKENLMVYQIIISCLIMPLIFLIMLQNMYQNIKSKDIIPKINEFKGRIKNKI